MNRRFFLRFLASLPLVGPAAIVAARAVPASARTLTVAEALRRQAVSPIIAYRGEDVFTPQMRAGWLSVSDVEFLETRSFGADEVMACVRGINDACARLPLPLFKRQSR